METKLEKIISIGEIITTEFKESKSTLPKGLFETVCAFLNTKGGYIFLGVNDNREIVGIDEIPERSIAYVINSLKNKDIIERVGSDRTGYWKILK